MKKGLAVVVGTLLLSTYAFACGCCCCCCQSGHGHGHGKMMMKEKGSCDTDKRMYKHKKMMEKKEQKMAPKAMQKVQPQNIDKNNVGITSNESADQTDPTLIEGNLENNDFKN